MPFIPASRCERRRLVVHEIFELLAELLQRQARRGREFRELVRIVEVVAAQADHVAPRDRVARRVDVDQAHLRASGGRVEQLLEGIGTKWPPCIEIITPLPPESRYFAAQ